MRKAKLRSNQTGEDCSRAEALVIALERADRLAVQLALLVRVAEARGAASRSRTAPSAGGGRRVRHRPPPVASSFASCVWKRSSTWWMRIPNRCGSVCSRGIAKTRANL